VGKALGSFAPLVNAEVLLPSASLRVRMTSESKSDGYGLERALVKKRVSPLRSSQRARTAPVEMTGLGLVGKNKQRHLPWPGKDFGREAGFSTSQFAKSANCSGRNDRIWIGGRTSNAEVDSLWG
jgi:hypothetical protein